MEVATERWLQSRRGRVSVPAQAALSGSHNQAPGFAGGIDTFTDPNTGKSATYNFSTYPDDPLGGTGTLNLHGNPVFFTLTTGWENYIPRSNLH